MDINKEGLEYRVGERLREKGYTLAVAESCSGGLFSSRITDIPGSSKYFLEGIVCYSNKSKISVLRVDENLIKRHGAVSREVALDMARCVREQIGATHGVSITGISGPGREATTKPVGLVYIGLASDSDVEIFECAFNGTRTEIKEKAVDCALEKLLLLLERGDV